VKRNQVLTWFCCTVLLFCGVTAVAQTITGSIRGTVTDPSGAVVAGANVTVTNVATNVEAKAVTNSDGLYNFQFLNLGDYTITATASGFTTTSVAPFRLQIDQIANIDVKLTVGAANTTVKVAADAGAILNTENATLGTSISSNQLQSMPLPGLNAVYATMFVPGAVNPTIDNMGGLEGSYRNTTPAGVPSFNGNRQQGNNFVLDGIEINETIQNLNGYNPSPYSLQEMRVITGNADAEYGNVDGAEIIMVSKAGTNNFHGSAFEYFENQNLGANSWGNDYSDLSKTKFHQHQFGGAVGGPIFKNKLFFFADYEGMRNIQPPSQATASVPDALERAGNFSEAAAVEGYSVWDTSGGTNNATEYPNDTIPAIVNPVANYLFAHPELLPLPNHPASPSTVTANNYVGLSAVQHINNQGDGRIDYTLSTHDTLMIKGTYGDAHDATTQQPLAISLFPVTDNYPFAMGVIDWIHTFSPSLVNELRAGYSRIVEDTEATDPTGVFGTNGDSIVGIPFPNQPIVGFSQMAISQTDNSSYGDNIQAGTKAIDNNFDYGDDLTWVHGNHVTRFGAQFVRYQENYVQPSNLGGLLGNFGYIGIYTSAGPSPGEGYADFELDKAQYAQVSGVTGAFGARQWRDAFYVQDDWKLFPNLTVNLGLRYAYDQPMYEAHDKMVSINLPAARFAPVGPNGPDPTPYLEFAGKNGNSRALVNPYYYQFMPRVGFALQMSPRAVLRGGYSITDDMEGTGNGLRMTQNPPFNVAFTQNEAYPGGTDGGTPLSVTNGFKSVTPGAPTAQYDIWDPNFRPAVVQQYNLTTQYLLASKTSLQIGYVGQVGQHIALPVLLNQYIAPVPATCPGTDTTGCVDLVAPYYAVVGGNSQIVETASRAYSNYNALQTTLHQQATDGLEFTLNYTWARAMSNSPVGFLAVAGTTNGFNYWQNAYDPNADYGPSSFDVRNNFSGTAVYQLPFGRGKLYGANLNRLTDEVLGGWELAANATAVSGYPILIRSNPHDNLNAAGSNYNYNYAIRANQYFPLKIVHRSLRHWFGTDPSALPCSSPGSLINANGVPCAYGVPAFNQFGDDKNGSERAPGAKNVDLSVYKAFRTVGNQYLKLRIDAYNALNTPSYAPPNSRAGSGSWGIVNNTSSAPRQLQISGVYTF
jgi:hypothetical protein